MGNVVEFVCHSMQCVSLYSCESKTENFIKSLIGKVIDERSAWKCWCVKTKACEPGAGVAIYLLFSNSKLGYKLISFTKLCENVINLKPNTELR